MITLIFANDEAYSAQAPPNADIHCTPVTTTTSTSSTSVPTSPSDLGSSTGG